jgi:predicted phosphodiesterase
VVWLLFARVGPAAVNDFADIERIFGARSAPTPKRIPPIVCSLAKVRQVDQVVLLLMASPIRVLPRTARVSALAPVDAVRGNVDHGAWSANLLVTQRIEIDGFCLYVLHILARLDPQAADNGDAVIYGHSHQPKIETKDGALFLNPGSAGPRRFGLPITEMVCKHIANEH